LSDFQSDPNSLSFIVVNRNTSKLLVECLKRIFASATSTKYEVIVVDNGSIDDSVALVNQLFPSVTLLKAGCNLGFAAANNLAVQKASGHFLLLVNTDAMLEKDCAEILLNHMERFPNVGMVGPTLLNADGSPQTSFESVPTMATEILNRSLLKRLFPTTYPDSKQVFNSPLEVEALIGAVMMIRSSAFEQVGGFDESYFFFLEETDLAVKIRNAGWKVVHEPNARAVHLQGQTANRLEAEARIEFYRSRYLFFRKHYGNVRAAFLKSALFANLTLNVIILGVVNSLPLFRNSRIYRKFLVRKSLLKWHLLGCPNGMGLPRT
jgi:GT2 family glycosyltransferase